MNLDIIIHDSKILGVDYNSNGDVIYIDEEAKVFRNNKKIKIKGLNQITTPVIKITSEERFLLIDKDGGSGMDNCWIINNRGTIESSFFIDCILEIVVTNEYVIASYGDSMFDNGSEFGDAQIVVFDYNGKVVFKYNSQENKSIVNFLENKAFVKQDENTILFMAYYDKELGEGFSVIQLNLIDFSSQRLFFIDNKEIEGKEIYFTGFTLKNREWYFFDQNTDSWDSKEEGACIIYKLDFGGSIKEYYRYSRLVVKPITGVFNQGFVFLSYPNLGALYSRIDFLRF
ncbi:hypothetical protein SAMN04489761_2221 [Tenacibaculum sp. MAR_2009_124]|uniref:hypothetical protein n=1 Tax=Tenacibaculum sp. MAR_2009_124 TaxID=1250059 RepID=UPI000897993F|nr:hypothetical protein [Tenacibaculum sp. MAR_2009_124]SEC00301.1 hypothetical protein SAMN04489761_2221 [Tenacibaculum sp. MAR_2009_124]